MPADAPGTYKTIQTKRLAQYDAEMASIPNDYACPMYNPISRRGEPQIAN